MKNFISKGTTSLIHHLSLSEINWWEKTIDKIIISVIGNNDNLPLAKKEVIERVMDITGSSRDRTAYFARIDSLLLQGQILLFKQNKEIVLLSQDTFTLYKSAIEEQSNIENTAKTIFLQNLPIEFSDTDKKNAWNNFINEVLIPTMRKNGLKFINLFSGGQVVDSGYFTEYEKFIKKHGEILRICVEEFFNSENKNIKSFILRLSNSMLFLEASSLSKEGVKKISSLSKDKPKFKLFVDTNFLFSFMKLHENASNEAADSLIALSKQINEQVDLKFLVLPITKKEAIGRLGHEMDDLRGIRLTDNMIEALAKENKISGIKLRYLDRAKKESILNPEEYFNPYINHFETTLQDFGIGFYNDARINHYSMNQQVIDDISDKIEKENKPGGRIFESKNKDHSTNIEYFRALHDYSLWHYVKDQRKNNIMSPKDAEFWVVTIDFSFLKFDSIKRKEIGLGRIPICLHPSDVIQLIRIWLPREEALDEAIFESFRLPFLFHNYNEEIEDATLKIIRAISTFENRSDLSVSTLEQIFGNEILNAKIIHAQNQEEEVLLVKEELIVINKSILEKISELENRVAKISEEATMSVSKEREERDSLLHKLNIEIENLRRENIDLQKLKEPVTMLSERNIEKNPVPLPEKKDSSSLYDFIIYLINILPRPIRIPISIAALFAIVWVFLFKTDNSNKQNQIKLISTRFTVSGKVQSADGNKLLEQVSSVGIKGDTDVFPVTLNDDSYKLSNVEIPKDNQIEIEFIFKNGQRWSKQLPVLNIDSTRDLIKLQPINIGYKTPTKQTTGSNKSKNMEPVFEITIVTGNENKVIK